MQRSPLGKLHRAAEWLQKRWTAKAAILMYHRITEAEFDPWGLCVTPQHFAEHLNVIQQQAHPISLQDLVKAHQSGNIPDRAVVITFDDGYADNLYHAKPLLEQHQIPATVFVTTGYLGQEREFWWDELERLLLTPGQLPEQLHLEINGSHHQWQLNGARHYSQQDYQNDRHRLAWEGEPGSRLALYFSIWQRLQPLPVVEQQNAIEQIRNWAGQDQSARATHRPLTPEEVCRLDQGNWVKVGAHTVHHLSLAAQTVEVQRQEIQQSKVELEKLLNRPVNHFAYPFGDYGTDTPKVSQGLGLDCACSTVETTVWRHSDRFQLPRFAIGNWTGAEFAKRLSRWFYG
ncbi:MAG: hypothetical protein Kow00121_18350 [Elainellaceae cyanobacterium]